MSQAVYQGICCFSSVELERRDSVTFIIPSRTRRRERFLLKALGGDSSRDIARPMHSTTKSTCFPQLGPGQGVSKRLCPPPLLFPAQRLHSWALLVFTFWKSFCWPNESLLMTWKEGNGMMDLGGPWSCQSYHCILGWDSEHVPHRNCIIHDWFHSAILWSHVQPRQYCRTQSSVILGTCL